MRIQGHILLCIFLVSTGTTGVQAQEGLIPEGKLQVHYQIQGTGTPLVFLHAGFQDLKMWDQQVVYFKKVNKVITIDLPGHGLTTGVDTSLLIQDVLRILLDSLHIEKASFAGLSVGAACIVDFVLAYPERVDKVVLVSPGLSGWAKVLNMDPISKQCFAQMEKVDSTKNFDSIATYFTNVWCIGPGRQPAAVNSYARNYVFQTTRANLQQHPEENRWPQLSNQPASLRIDQWKKPLLIIAGDEDLPFILSVSAWFHATVKGSQEVIIPHTAHMLNMEQPLFFNQTVRSFLKNDN
ncbi:MAG TPA: alpha/beta hydrolase [Puia sp.]|nr:alpha/beta hydrolase [Puia sp.]